jgi:hypothetical protein
VPGCGDGAQAQTADLDDRVVLEDVVVGREHGRVVGGDRHAVAGVAHGGDGLDVVPVAVGLQHLAHAELAAQLEQELVLVGGVEQDGVARLGAAEHEHVVVERPDHDLVDLGPLVVPVQRLAHRSARLRP